MRFALVLFMLLPLCAHAQHEPSLSPSQVDELDKEGLAVDPDQIGRPVIDCPDVLARVPRSQQTFLERSADSYLVLPNGDIINAFRALKIRESEQRLRTVSPSARTRAERELDELAPCGELVVLFEDGTKSFDPNDVSIAEEGDTLFEYDNLPPLYELPLDPQPGTSASFAILGSSDDSPETLNFRVREQTDHWLIGYVEQDGQRVSQRIAVHRNGATLRLDRLERSCILWPLNKTAENRREYWSRSPIPLYVALDIDKIRATPAHLACAAEQGRVVFKNHTARTEQSRKVTKTTTSITGTHLANRSRTNGPWLRRIYWTSTPVHIRVQDYETYQRKLAEKFERQERREEPASETPNAEITHTLNLRDGRSLQGTLDSADHADLIEFTVIVGAIQQPMKFKKADVISIERVDSGGG